METQEIIQRVDPATVLKIKEQVLLLYEKEVFARNLYFQELRKFEGDIFETVKWLSEQEAKHAETLQVVLTRAGIKIKEPEPKLPNLKTEQSKIIQIDVDSESEAMALYEKAIKNSSGALKELFEQFRNEEIIHIARLKNYLSE